VQKHIEPEFKEKEDENGVYEIGNNSKRFPQKIFDLSYI